MFGRLTATRQPAAIALLPLLAISCLAHAPTGGSPSDMADPSMRPMIIPQPLKLTPGNGLFLLKPAARIIVTDTSLLHVGNMLATYMRAPTGARLPVVSGRAGESGSILLRRDRSLSAQLGDEGYRLNVTPSTIEITSAAAPGAFYGVQSLRQLFHPAIFAAAASDVAWRVNAVSIEDVPRFRWRGSHLDVSRHFMPKDFVKRYIDLLAMHKMNSFHWHLTDDQGWRVEIRKYPRLTEVGGWRSETLVGSMRRNLATATYDGVRHGGYYTQDEIREVVAYARERFINVVPEIEMPGHAQAVIAAYPHLASTSAAVEVRKVWGVSEHLLNPSDSTINFLKDVMEEVLTLFPGQFIHIGGDEAVKTEWRTHPIAHARMQEKGLTTEDELQSWFIRQFDDFLTQKGRRMVGWDEILEGGLAPNAVVMSWRGVNGGIEAARSGHDVIMTPTSHTYFDYYQSREPGEPLAIGGFLPLDTVYNYEPVPAQLEPQFVKHILGAQAQLWTEYMPDGKHVEYMAYPRMCALAEVVWTDRSRKDLAGFKERLATHLRRLDYLGVNYRK